MPYQLSFKLLNKPYHRTSPHLNSAEGHIIADHSIEIPLSRIISRQNLISTYQWSFSLDIVS